MTEQPKEYTVEVPADRKWTLTVTDDIGCADIWEKGYTDEDSILTINVRSSSQPNTTIAEQCGGGCCDSGKDCMVAAQAKKEVLDDFLLRIESKPFNKDGEGERCRVYEILEDMGYLRQPEGG